MLKLTVGYGILPVQNERGLMQNQTTNDVLYDPDDMRIWGEKAKCKGKPASWWYTESYATLEGRLATQKAKAVCSSCPVRMKCLEHANTNGETFGIWGGLTPKERGVGRLSRPGYKSR